MSPPSLTKSKQISQGPLNPAEARWTRLVKTTYTDPLGVERTWESAERQTCHSTGFPKWTMDHATSLYWKIIVTDLAIYQTRPATAKIDGVGIVTILNKPSGPELLLQKQYRPPIDKVVIEVPAGLIDVGETPEECAVRELKEETGYVGVAELTSPIMYNDPGFCNTNLNMVHVSVDMSLPENQNLKPELEENEFIECFSIPLASLYEETKKLEQQGYAIDARIGTLAEGMELMKKWKL
ncbi:ADP-ribose pyrophosphatase [Penicillium odoratum]|uniref:ADP-ribose pyrophosphatase n=1 Tax=Penicillium odoratum TaxID=1167516 RepID=UPI0025482E78|nr:ADP-ribose pyrophosphatase [Penicillium odoratum]KAJ5759890.1 ADP-ribose pyrophosphatase [Penicillium odoratum]